MKKEVIVSGIVGFVVCLGVCLYAFRYTTLPSLIWGNVLFVTAQEQPYVEHTRNMINYRTVYTVGHIDIPFSIEIPVLWNTYADTAFLVDQEITPSIARALISSGKYVDLNPKEIVAMSDDAAIEQFNEEFLVYPVAAIARTSQPTYQDWTADQINFSVIDGIYPTAELNGTYIESVPQDAISTTIDGYKAMIITDSDNNNPLPSKDAPGGKTILIYVEEKEKVLMIQQQARGDASFEQDVVHMLETVDILL